MTTGQSWSTCRAASPKPWSETCRAEADKLWSSIWLKRERILVKHWDLLPPVNCWWWLWGGVSFLFLWWRWGFRCLLLRESLQLPGRTESSAGYQHPAPGFHPEKQVDLQMLLHQPPSSFGLQPQQKTQTGVKDNDFVNQKIWKHVNPLPYLFFLHGKMRCF